MKIKNFLASKKTIREKLLINFDTYLFIAYLSFSVLYLHYIPLLEPLRNTFLLGFGWMLLSSISRDGLSLRELGQARLYFMLVGYYLLTLFWTTLPNFELFPFFELLFHTLIAVLLASRFKTKDQIQVYFWSFLFILSVSTILILFFPSIGLTPYTKRNINSSLFWQGNFYHKNQLGIFSALALILFLLKAISERGNKLLLTLFMSLMATTLLIGSSCVTAIFSLFATASSVLILYLFSIRRNFIYDKLLIAFLLLFILVSITYFDQILTFFNREATLTGRIPLWREVILKTYNERFWFGFGYAGFWGRSELELISWPSYSVFQTIKWYPYHSHSGFIDSFVHGGIVGAVLFLSLFLRGLYLSISQALQVFKNKKTEVIYLWPFVFFIFMLFSNLVESVLFMTQTSFLFYGIIFTITYICLEKGKKVRVVV